MIRLAMLLASFTDHWKMLLASVFAVATTIANVVVPEISDNWSKLEDITLKLALLVAVIILWRVWQADRERFRQEIIAQRDRHDEKMETIVRENTESNRAVVATMKALVDEDSKLVREVAKETITKHGRDRP